MTRDRREKHAQPLDGKDPLVVAGFMHRANGFFMNWSDTQKG